MSSDDVAAPSRAESVRLAQRLVVPRSDNFVARPWGGRRLAELKLRSMAAAPNGATARAGAADSAPIGESFELAAFDADAEAAAYPSRVPLADGRDVALPRLLDAHGDAFLGPEFIARHGRRWPLLPKLLDVVELLSVQGHPPGNTEVYVIVDAEPGASIRLGFAADVDAADFAARLKAGRRTQQALLELAGAALSPAALQSLLKPWLATRAGRVESLRTAFGASFGAARPLLASLHELYWHVLDLMNEIPVRAGQVIHNATPARIAAATGRVPSAEVHALGNPEGREIVALEIRRPGPTFRAWDNVRFPLRDIDIDAALAAFNLARSAPEDFIATPRSLPGRPGVAVSVDSAQYRLEHLTPEPARAVSVPAEPPHGLHVLAGAVSVYATDGVLVGRLVAGDSALVPIGVGAYRVAADEAPAHVVKASLPA